MTHLLMSLNMKINKLNLTSENLFLVDQFFKSQFKNNQRYGEMGYFYWKLLKNKISNGFINSYSEMGDIVATTSITPKSILYKSKVFSVAEIGDTYVDKKYQGRGFFTDLVNKSEKDAKDFYFIYGLPNHLSLPIYLKRCNFQLINSLDLHSFIYPLSINKFLSNRIGNSLASFINMFYKLYVKSSILFFNLKYNFSKTYTYQEIEKFNESFDIFWNKASKEWDFIFMRNKKMINWRFDENPKKYKKLIFKKESNVIGYLVYSESYEEDSRIIIADFLFLKEHIEAFDYSLYIIKKIALKRRINGISLWYTLKSVFTKTLFENRFYKNNTVPFIINKGNNDLVELNNIHFTISDSDNV